MAAACKEELFSTIKLLHCDSKWSDLTFVCRDGSVSSHCIIISSASKFLQPALKEAYTQEQKVTIILPDATSYVLRVALKFFYHGLVWLDKKGKHTGAITDVLYYLHDGASSNPPVWNPQTKTLGQGDFVQTFRNPNFRHYQGHLVSLPGLSDVIVSNGEHTIGMNRAMLVCVLPSLKEILSDLEVDTLIVPVPTIHLKLICFFIYTGHILATYDILKDVYESLIVTLGASDPSYDQKDDCLECRHLCELFVPNIGKRSGGMVTSLDLGRQAWRAPAESLRVLTVEEARVSSRRVFRRECVSVMPVLQTNANAQNNAVVIKTEPFQCGSDPLDLPKKRSPCLPDPGEQVERPVREHSQLARRSDVDDDCVEILSCRTAATNPSIRSGSDSAALGSLPKEIPSVNPPQLTTSTQEKSGIPREQVSSSSFPGSFDSSMGELESQLDMVGGSSDSLGLPCAPGGSHTGSSVADFEAGESGNVMSVVLTPDELKEMVEQLKQEDEMRQRTIEKSGKKTDESWLEQTECVRENVASHRVSEDLYDSEEQNGGSPLNEFERLLKSWEDTSVKTSAGYQTPTHTTTIFTSSATSLMTASGQQAFDLTSKSGLIPPSLPASQDSQDQMSHFIRGLLASSPSVPTGLPKVIEISSERPEDKNKLLKSLLERATSSYNVCTTSKPRLGEVPREVNIVLQPDKPTERRSTFSARQQSSRSSSVPAFGSLTKYFRSDLNPATAGVSHRVQNQGRAENQNSMYSSIGTPSQQQNQLKCLTPVTAQNAPKMIVVPVAAVQPSTSTKARPAVLFSQNMTPSGPSKISPVVQSANRSKLRTALSHWNRHSAKTRQECPLQRSSPSGSGPVVSTPANSCINISTCSTERSEACRTNVSQGTTLQVSVLNMSQPDRTIPVEGAQILSLESNPQSGIQYATIRFPVTQFSQASTNTTPSRSNPPPSNTPDIVASTQQRCKVCFDLFGSDVDLVRHTVVSHEMCLACSKKLKPENARDHLRACLIGRRRTGKSSPAQSSKSPQGSPNWATILPESSSLRSRSVPQAVSPSYDESSLPVIESVVSLGASSPTVTQLPEVLPFAEATLPAQIFASDESNEDTSALAVCCSDTDPLETTERDPSPERVEDEPESRMDLDNQQNEADGDNCVMIVDQAVENAEHVAQIERPIESEITARMRTRSQCHMAKDDKSAETVAEGPSAESESSTRIRTRSLDKQSAPKTSAPASSSTTKISGKDIVIEFEAVSPDLLANGAIGCDVRPPSTSVPSIDVDDEISIVSENIRPASAVQRRLGRVTPLGQTGPAPSRNVKTIHKRPLKIVEIDLDPPKKKTEPDLGYKTFCVKCKNKYNTFGAFITHSTGCGVENPVYRCNACETLRLREDAMQRHLASECKRETSDTDLAGFNIDNAPRIKRDLNGLLYTKVGDSVVCTECGAEILDGFATHYSAQHAQLGLSRFTSFVTISGIRFCKLCHSRVWKTTAHVHFDFCPHCKESQPRNFTSFIAHCKEHEQEQLKDSTAAPAEDKQPDTTLMDSEDPEIPEKTLGETCMKTKLKESSNCPICPTVDGKELVQHVREVHLKLKCNVCLGQFPGSQEMLKHATSAHNVSSDRFSLFCWKCKTVFFNVADAIKHISQKGHHEKFSNIQCCGKPHSTKNRPKGIFEHLRLNHYSWQCSKCPQKLIGLEALKDHASKVHGIESAHKSRTCQHCLTILYGKVATHSCNQRYTHLVCMDCDYVAETPDALQMHTYTNCHMMLTHCSLCDKQLFTSSALRVHNASSHPEQGRVLCEVCAEELNLCDLEAHRQEKHTGSVTVEPSHRPFPSAGRLSPRTKKKVEKLRAFRIKTAENAESPSSVDSSSAPATPTSEITALPSAAETDIQSVVADPVEQSTVEASSSAITDLIEPGAESPEVSHVQSIKKNAVTKLLNEEITNPPSPSSDISDPKTPEESPAVTAGLKQKRPAVWAQKFAKKPKKDVSMSVVTCMYCHETFITKDSMEEHYLKVHLNKKMKN